MLARPTMSASPYGNGFDQHDTVCPRTISKTTSSSGGDSMYLLHHVTLEEVNSRDFDVQSAP